MSQKIAKILVEISKIYKQKETLDPRIHLQPILRDLKSVKRSVEQGQKLIKKLDAQNLDFEQEIIKFNEEKPVLEEEIKKHKEELAIARDTTLKEMIAIQQIVKSLEEKTSNGILRIDEINDTIKKNQDRKQEIKHTIAGLKKQYNDKVSLYNKKKADIDLKMAALLSQEEGAREKLGPEVLSVLDETVETVDSRPIVFLKDDTCTGCCLGVSDQIARYVAREESIQRCENCKRILLPASYMGI